MVSVIVLAAGEGKRMNSDLPKPLHRVGGTPMVLHVINACAELSVRRIVVVVGHGADQMRSVVASEAPPWANVLFAEQTVRDGTGGATMIGLSALDKDEIPKHSTIIVVPGDTPLLRTATLNALVREHEGAGNAATLLSSVMDDATGYGRVVRDSGGNVIAIVEHRDATGEQLAITEINTGTYAFRAGLLGPALQRISNANSQSEYYLTDVIDILVSEGHRVGCVLAPADETAGVNDLAQLAHAESVLSARAEKGR